MCLFYLFIYVSHIYGWNDYKGMCKTNVVSRTWFFIQELSLDNRKCAKIEETLLRFWWISKWELIK